MQAEVLIPFRRTALCIALAVLAFPSAALELGPPEVLSGIGESLDARIPVRTREGEWFHAKCLSLAPAPQQAPFPPDSTLSVERRRSTTHLRVRSGAPVNEPALAFTVSSTCAGASELIGAPVTLLIDPPRVDRAPRAKAPEAALPAAPAPRAAERRAPAPASPAPAPAPLAAAPQAQPKAAAVAQAPEGKPDPPAAPAASAPARAQASGDFVLRLSSSDIDVSRTRQFDEPSRARLRERLRLLDSDDQVAEMLSMRDNLRRLEARVAELQLKLAAMPTTFPAPTVRPEPPKAVVEAPKVADPPKVVEAPKVAEAPQAVETPKVIETPQVAAAAKVEPDPPKVTTVAPRPAPAINGQPAPDDSVLGALESFQGRLIAAGLAGLLMLILLGAWLWSRWRHAARDEVLVEGDDAATVILESDEPVALGDSIADESPIEIAEPARAEVISDAALATRLEEDTEALRRRYIEERFPEIRAGTIVLDDPASVVKGARLFYEDGALPRAVELLRFAVEDRPGEIRPFLALFEIYRLEHLTGEYSELAGRFRERHGSTPQWDKVCSFGRELDPANELFREPPTRSLETIGPREARRIAAARADPMMENWLDAPMDFENEVLSTELRRSLMTRARVDEGDLVPNPMPALRSVEMFSVG